VRTGAEIGAHPRELAGHERALRIGDHRAHRKGVGRRVEFLADPVNRALMHLVIALDAHADRHRRAARRPRAAQIGKLPGTRLHLDLDRIDLNQGRETRLAGGDQVANIRLGKADLAVEWRLDHREFEIETGTLELGLEFTDLRRRRVAIAPYLVEVALRGKVLVGKFGNPRHLTLEENQRGPRTLEPRLKLVDAHLEGARIKPEEHRALLDKACILDVARLEIAGDTRGQLHPLRGNQPPTEGGRCGNILARDLRDIHPRRAALPGPGGTALRRRDQFRDRLGHEAVLPAGAREQAEKRLAARHERHRDDRRCAERGRGGGGEKSAHLLPFPLGIDRTQALEHPM
jgi:hypothetical protein